MKRAGNHVYCRGSRCREVLLSQDKDNIFSNYFRTFEIVSVAVILSKRSISGNVPEGSSYIV